MRSKFKWIFTLLVAFTMQFSFAQEKTVTGTVKDEKGMVLSGANVKNGSVGVSTSTDGKFAIKAQKGDVVSVSYLGMETSTFKVGASDSYNVKLTSKDKILDEVVINLGYNKTASKPKSTAAAVTVDSKLLNNRPNVSVLQSLQGAAAGLTVTTSSGNPGSAKTDLLIRGIGSLTGSTEPLYVIDGVPSNSVLFRNINPNDIETLSVLKDAIATSIYGNRGANGVILVKTKAGSYNSKLKVSYASVYGVNYMPGEKYNLANSQEAFELENRWGYGAGFGDNPYLGVLTDEQKASYSTTDWKKVFFRVATNQNQNISLSGGGEKVNTFTSVSYSENQGIVPTTDFKRFTLRSNINGRSQNDKFNYGLNFTGAFSRRNQLDQEGNSGVNNNTVQNPLLGSLTSLPYYNTDMYPGSGQALYDYIGTSFDYGTTSFVLQDILTKGNVPNRIDEMKFLGNLNVSYKFTNNLTFNSKLGIDYNQSDRTFARAPWSYLAIAVRESNTVPFGGFERYNTDKDFGVNFVNNLSYEKAFGKHTLNFGVYSEYLKAHRSINQLQQNGLDLANYSFGAGSGWTNVGATYASLRPTVSAAKLKAGSFSYFGTIGYDFDNRIGFDAVIRRDASYRFVQDYKWGTFWSVGGRWNIDKEKFMDGSTFSMLKLRASIGTQGNQNILGNAAGQNPIYLANNLVRDLVSSGTGYSNSGALFLSQIKNTSLHWEEQTMKNVGVDFELLNSKLSGAIDVYSRKTGDLFLDDPIPAFVGNGASINGNKGNLSNKGIELSFRYKLISKNDFKLSVFTNGSYNKSEVYGIDSTPDGDYINENGSLPFEFYYVPYLGVNPANGNLQFLDINNNVTEAPDDTDRRRTGKNSTPQYQGGFGFNMDYKGFFLDTQFTWATKVWRLDYALLWLYNPNYIGDNNVSSDLLNAWTPSNTDTDVPALEATNFSSGTDYSDRFLKDASYLRAKSVMFGYNFNKKFLRDTFFKSLKIYCQAENFYTWTKWRGFDPESAEDSNLGKYPTPKTFSMGINVEF